MKFFGGKSKAQKQAENTCELLIEHIFTNGGFVNRNGTFDSDGDDPVIREHWRLFHKLATQFYEAKRMQPTFDEYAVTVLQFIGLCCIIYEASHWR